MVNNTEKRFFAPSSLEGARTLRAVEVTAATIGQAMEKVEAGAGQAELDWVLANPEEARKMLITVEGDDKDYSFFFPAATTDDGSEYEQHVFWSHDRFWRGRVPYTFKWHPNVDRIVQLDPK